MLRRARESKGISVEEAARLYSVSVIDIGELELTGRARGINVMEYAETVLQLKGNELATLASVMWPSQKGNRWE